jgi:glycosyltransferase involved in cell wall biosynthesis
MLPKISIVTICFNAEETIELTIQSVVRQSYENIEYIIIDGNSSDNTMEIVKRYEDRIDIVSSERDDGIYNAMNKGLLKASGDFVLFLNADDQLLAPTTIENAARHIALTPDSHIIYGSIFEFNSDTSEGSIWKEKLPSAHRLYRTTIPHPSSFFRREPMLKLKGYDERYRIGGDHEYFIRALFAKHTFKRIPTLITKFSKHGASNSEASIETMRLERKRAIDENYPLWLKFVCAFFEAVRI